MAVSKIPNFWQKETHNYSNNTGLEVRRNYQVSSGKINSLYFLLYNGSGNNITINAYTNILTGLPKAVTLSLLTITFSSQSTFNAGACIITPEGAIQNTANITIPNREYVNIGGIYIMD